ncbi:hypothetical protein PVAP13_6NG316400, partial [Panicum virgatum]
SACAAAPPHLFFLHHRTQHLPCSWPCCPGFTKPAGTGPVTAVTGLTGPDRPLIISSDLDPSPSTRRIRRLELKSDPAVAPRPPPLAPSRRPVSLAPHHRSASRFDSPEHRRGGDPSLSSSPPCPCAPRRVAVAAGLDWS